jgi:Phosphoenolpyruvate phosphomutase
MLESDGLTIMPCCYDGLTARLVEQAGFDLTFMTGFGVSSTYGLPDTGKTLSIFQLFVSGAPTLLSTLFSNDLRSLFRPWLLNLKWFLIAGLISFEEMVQSASVISNSLRSIPCIGDGDTGYGNPMNVKRTVAKYAQAGMAGIMIEDQASSRFSTSFVMKLGVTWNFWKKKPHTCRYVDLMILKFMK